MYYKASHSGIGHYVLKDFKSELAAKQWLGRNVQPSVGGRMTVAVMYAVDGGYRYDTVAVKDGYSNWRKV